MDSIALWRHRLFAPFILLILCGISFFWRLGANGIWDLDEALYVESAREMSLTGDYITPRVNGAPFFEKPPLVYWEAAGLFRLFGKSELAARVPSAVASAAVVFLIYGLGFRLFGRRAAHIAAAGFALCPMALGTARQLTTDATLDLWIFVALAAFLEHDGRRMTGDGRGVLLPLVFWAACGLGVLAKGLPGILIPVVVSLLYIGYSERWSLTGIVRRATRMRPAIGFALFLAIALPWHVAAWNVSGHAFYDEYVVRQHLARFRGGDTAHLAPVWFYIPGFLLGLFPLSLFVPAALLDGPRDHAESTKEHEGERSGEARLLLKVWIVVVFVMFSASGSKLISYILPMYPPAALLAGDWLTRHVDAKDRRRTLLWTGGVALALSCLLLGVTLLHAPIIRIIESRTHSPVRLDQIPPGTFEWAAHLLGAAAVGAAAFLLLTVVRRPWIGLAAMGIVMTMFAALAVGEGLPLLNRSLLAPLKDSATSAGSEAASADVPLVVYVAPPRRPSVFFYLPDLLIGKGRIYENAPGEERSENNPLLTGIGKAVILTTASRGQRLARANHDIRVLSTRQGWVVLETPAR